MTQSPPAKPAASDPKTERLAKALRDNLRRRKAPPTSGDKPASDPENAS